MFTNRPHVDRMIHGNNSHQDRMQHDNSNYISLQKKAHELDMLEEEQTLKERYLDRKYEILQQYGDAPNNYRSNVNGAEAIRNNLTQQIN